MTELKTLKDLKDKHGIFGPEYVMIDKLKAEAVKWVKSLDNYDNENMETKEWIRFFFNLTEEDLK